MEDNQMKNHELMLSMQLMTNILEIMLHCDTKLKLDIYCDEILNGPSCEFVFLHIISTFLAANAAQLS